MSNKQLLISCLEAVSNKCLYFAIPGELCMSFFLFFLKILKLAMCVACPSGHSSIPRYQHCQQLFPLFFSENRIQTFCHLILCKCTYFLIDNFNCYFMQCFFFYSLSAISLEMPQKSGSAKWHFFPPCQMQISHLPSVNMQRSLITPPFFKKITKLGHS